MNSRRSLQCIAASCLAALVAWSSTHGQPASPVVQSITAINVTVSDVQRSTQFFCDVLRFKKAGERPASGPEISALTGIHATIAHIVSLQLGNETLLLTEYEDANGRPMPRDSRGNDLWFQHIAIVVSDINAATARLRENAVELVTDKPQRLPAWNPNAAGIAALYFRDPDGHFLEVIEYPADKGAARWHEPTEELFLGIDHTALVVTDTERSLRFYRDDLGLTVAGVSENYGPEQERLNGVPAAHLRITTLRPSAGPGVELLQYVTPTDGRSRPSQSTPADLWHWQIECSVSAIKTCSDACTARETLANDPDGHVVKLSATDAEE